MKKLLPAFALLLLLAACSKEPNYAPGYIGNWAKGSTQVKFNEDNSYSLTNSDVMYAGTGTYEVSSTNITLKDNSGNCPDSILGTYIYRDFVSSSNGTFAEQLELNLLFDTCIVRAAILPGTYTVSK